MEVRKKKRALPRCRSEARWNGRLDLVGGARMTGRLVQWWSKMTTRRGVMIGLDIECERSCGEVKEQVMERGLRITAITATKTSLERFDSLAFPLITPDWYADEEILLLEGIEMYGLGNWAEVAEHVGTKSKAHCIDHYTTVYLNSPCYPLPDMSHVVGKNRKELLAMAKAHGELKKGFPGAGESTPKEDSPFSLSRVKIEEPPTGRSPASLTAVSSESNMCMVPSNKDGDSGDSKLSAIAGSSTNVGSAGAGKKASNMAQADGIKVEGVSSADDSQIDRSIGGKKPRYTGDEGPSMTELSGYNPKRQEFDPEYDNDAEQLLAEMEFKETDTEAERELKLRVLRIYSSRFALILLSNSE
ncbi:Transcriptional adapter ada2 [Asimina triloba]